MRQDEATEIARKYINADKEIMPCHIVAIRFIPAEDESERDHWAAVLRFDDDVDGADTAYPIVCIDDETGEASIMEGL